MSVMQQNESKQTTLDLDFFERIFLCNCLVNKNFLTSVLDFTEASFFNCKHFGRFFSVLKDYLIEHNKLPSLVEMRIRMGDVKDREAFQYCVEAFRDIDLSKIDSKELEQNAERFLKERMLYQVILNAADTLSNPKQVLDVTQVLKRFERVASVSLNENLGLFYFRDIDKHLEALTETHKPIPTGWSFFDSRTEGGFFSKTLNVFAGQVNVGKSIVLGNLATNLIKNGFNVLLLTLEMSELMYAKRINACLTGIPFSDLKLYPELVKEKLNEIQKKISTQLLIKEYPPKTITVQHVNTLLTKLQRNNFKPDVVIVDYLNLLQASTRGLSLYEGVKDISEQLRALSFRWDVPIVTATQLRRSGFNTANPGLDEVSECIEVNQKIKLRDGTVKSIGDVKVGDQIIANDGYKTVIQVHHRQIKRCYKLKLKSGKEIIVSEKHKFPTQRGRLSIEDGLSIGDRLNSIT